MLSGKEWGDLTSERKKSEGCAFQKMLGALEHGRMEERVPA